MDRVFNAACVGDSLTLGIGASVGHDYPSLLTAGLSLGIAAPIKRVTNWGIGGGTLTNDFFVQSAAVNATIDSQSEDVLNLLFLWGGANDFKQLLQTGETAFGLYYKYGRLAQELGWNTAAFTALPRSSPMTPSSFEVDRDIFNHLLRTNWCDCFDVLVDVAADHRIGQFGCSDDPAYYVDQTHLTDLGCSIVAAMAASQVALVPYPWKGPN